MHILGMILIGLLTGVCSGIFGIGGGVIIVPSLVFLLGFSQQTANGTSLVALLLPVGLLGVLEYYKVGKIDSTHIKAGFLIAIGIFFGAYLGAKIAIALPELILKRVFSVFLFLMAIRLWVVTK